MKPTKRLFLLNDDYLQKIQYNWFNGSHHVVTKEQYIAEAVEWYRSSHRNDIQGWNSFPYVDVALGCTHFIESLLLKHRNLQVLTNDYSYYGLIGMPGTIDPEQLIPNSPLIISLPNWHHADLRPNWPDILKICEKKSIDIHIDMAWIIAAKDISIDLSHPCIKSFAMSLSKYSMQWNRIGLRWTRQRTIDSITMFNHYQGAANASQISCGSYIMQNIDIDYGWNTYENKYYKICTQHNLSPSKIFYVAHDTRQNCPMSIASILASSATLPN